MEEKRANPAPLGLLGFGMTTVLLNLHNVGVVELTVMIAAMGAFVGGLAQLIAGILEFKSGNTFGGTAFVAYGCFWLSLVAIWWNPFGLGVANNISMGAYLLIWALFTLIMFIAAFKHNIITRIVFGSLTLLFILLAAGDFSLSGVVTIIAGAVGIFCGISAMYSAAGQIIKSEFGKKLFLL